MARKMTAKEMLIALGITYAVIYLSTAVVWLWPDASLWVLGVVSVLSVLGVLWAYRISHKQSPPASPSKE